MTLRQQQALHFIEQYQVEHEGVSPTMQEIGGGLGIGRCAVFELVDAMSREGVVRRDKQKTRGIEVLQPSDRSRAGLIRRAVEQLRADGHAELANELRRLAPAEVTP